MEMHFTKDELKPQTEGDNEGGRFKNKNVHRFLAKNGIKQKLSLLNNKRHTANNKSNGNVNKVK